MPIVEPTREAPKQVDFKTPDGYEFYLNLGPLTNLNEKYFKNKVPFWNEMMKHPNYDEYWKERDLRRGLKDIKPAVMTVGGWFDAEDLFGPLKVYESIEKNSPGAYNILVMGPWYHGQWANHDGDKMGHVPFNAKTSLFYREKNRVTVLPALLERRERTRPAGSLRFRIGHEPVAALRFLASQAGHREDAVFPS